MMPSSVESLKPEMTTSLALSATDVVISGFNDSTEEGIIRWSHDGGTTWTSDIVLTTTGWSYRVRFANHKDGLVLDGLATKSANAAHYTTNGGAHASDGIVHVVDNVREEEGAPVVAAVDSVVEGADGSDCFKADSSAHDIASIVR